MKILGVNRGRLIGSAVGQELLGRDGHRASALALTAPPLALSPLREIVAVIVDFSCCGQRARPHRSRGVGRPHGVAAEPRGGAGDPDLPHR